MHFGFSYVGLIYLIMLFVPNIKWAKNKPEGYEQFAAKENKILLVFERTGEILCSAVVLVFSDFNIHSIHGWKWWNCWLILSFFLMILYEMYWYRYFKSSKTMRDQYSSFCGFPVAGATLPVLAFFLLGIYGFNIFLIIASLILGVGHIGIHVIHEKEVREPDEKLGMAQIIIRWKWVILAMILLLSAVVCLIFGKIRGLVVLNFSSNAERYEYDSDNLLGLKATVVDGRNYTYVFDGDLCIFNEYDVMKANQKNEIVSAFRNIPNFTPELVYFNRKSGDIYLTLCFGDNVDMDRVDGFYLYLSDTEWITVNQPKDITSVDHYLITDHCFHNIGTDAEYESWFGNDWTQVWNKDGSGKWSEVRDRHYGRDTMPRE